MSIPSPARLWMAGLVMAATTTALLARPATSQQPNGRAEAPKTQSHQDPLAGRIRGATTAPVTVYEMSDFQCPFCRRFALETFPTLEREYIATGKVRWAFINYPLTSLHDNAVAAAELGLCAARQERFWPVHTMLYRTQSSWGPLADPAPFLLGLADSVGLDRPTTVACLEAPGTRIAVQRDAEGAARSGARSTPSFYIEGGLLTGAQPLPVFRRILDSVYAAKTGTKRKP